MNAAARLRQLDAALSELHAFWHPQPFRRVNLPWAERLPELHAAVLALDDKSVETLNGDSAAALRFLQGYLPAAGALLPLTELPALPGRAMVVQGGRWAWEIPGRKQAQIEAFAAVARQHGSPVLDWCGGKGHLGRLLALAWQVPVETLEIDTVLCAEGLGLARRLGLPQDFLATDALQTQARPLAGQHAVALHACGELHRRLIARGCEAGVAAFDVAPCCYYRGVEALYAPMSAGASLSLTRDDTRLAVTETVTASPRLARQRDREMAWKLAFDALRQRLGIVEYRSFKPVPAAWMRAGFADFLALLAAREGIVLGAAELAQLAPEVEAEGWRRQAEVMRLSVVRHAFRRALELWLVSDLAACLEARGYVVAVGEFCQRRLTPRNILISARRAA